MPRWGTLQLQGDRGCGRKERDTHDHVRFNARFFRPRMLLNSVFTSVMIIRYTIQQTSADT